MSRIQNLFTTLKGKGRKALVGYIVNGDPSPEATLPTMHKLAEQGVDIIEVGVPFSDPMAEGPVIQKGHERALRSNVSLRDTLKVVSEFRKTDTDTPVVLMGYANPVEKMGYSTFAALAQEAGVDGLITVDLPPEELGDLKQELDKREIDNIFLLAPTTTPERARQIVGNASGFLYYVSLKGVTGAGHLDVDAVKAKLDSFDHVSDLPLCVGFGIKDAASAAAVAKLADGVVIGSVLVNKMGELAAEPVADIANGVGAIVADIRRALDQQ